MTLFTAGLMTFILWDVSVPSHLIFWVLLVIVGAFLRIDLSRRFSKKDRTEKTIGAHPWERLTRFSTLLSGIVWGLGGVWLYPAGDAARGTFLSILNDILDFSKIEAGKVSLETKETQQDRLFEAFSQANSSTTRNFGGTGLGLAICSRLVGLMAGKIEMKSTYGKGSTFQFTVPFGRVQGRIYKAGISPGPWHTDTAIETDRFRGMRILVVEDNKINQQVIRGLLEKGEIDVSVAENGQEAINAITKDSFDAVLMDLQMPVMDGLQATQKIRRNSKFKDIPIIALTANVFQTDVEKCFAAGMNDHLAKPVKLDELFAMLSKWIGAGGGSSVGDGPSREQIPPIAGSVIGSDSHSLAPIPGLDTAAALSLLGGNDILLKELFSIFYENESGTVDRIRTAFSKDDTTLAHRLAHTLKSSAGAVGAGRLEKASLAVEAVFRKGGRPGEDMLEEFEAAHAEVMDGLNALKA